MKAFEIWIEGFAATGQSQGAHMIGSSQGNSFDEAVENYIIKNPDCVIEKNGRGRYMDDEAYANRRSNWNIWACNLFDNEIDARKSFG